MYSLIEGARFLNKGSLENDLRNAASQNMRFFDVPYSWPEMD